MKFLLVYSNHHSENFNHYLLENVKNSLLRADHEFVVRDLYKLDFNPVLRTPDFEAIASGNTPQDIAMEQSFINWADVMVFIYPVWWGSMPAIMKGYIDRVFSWGFAYKSGENGVTPLLTGKKAVIMSTLGQSRAEYENGMHQSMLVVNELGVFGFCGIEVLSQLNFYSIHSLSADEKQKAMNDAGKVLLDIGNTVAENA